MFVTIQDLTFKYKNVKSYTVDHLNLHIKKGEIISILGESGSGKSTVLRLLCGLEKPEKGRIVINEETMTDDHTFVLPEKRGVGMVFQDYALFPHMTVAENIRFGLKGMKQKEKKMRVDEVLSLVNMTAFTKRYPHELSGGQQQRIALARALAPKPSLLLLDEPFSNLDADLQIKIRSELKDIIKKTGTTSILVTHDREDSKAIADRILTIRDGAAYNWESICTMKQDPSPQSQLVHMK
ncbi:ABC transporter ATP-binding protein [Halobacillus sp. ACCC02827]|uniref:ABC transporter ATP-binding protein n=1 Tax=Bacillaceae TaxID=186817 RepID=UPI0002A4EBBC|nr:MULTISPECIES: ABC transporter ATP-binding protein [Bacillaceae]ELK47432.1 iron(III) ABC transporter ATP-binding protein [Halobacillus sp. BAB-2008]QHT48254.1 ABC transporter ATP-binding protein [Bacillus sp. SB49]WJE15492.1 ABC transporter ATP-binding protein [Halobacillus sp. ACCC02827]